MKPPREVNPRTHLSGNNPLCSAWEQSQCPKKAKVVIGPVAMWPNGEGYQRKLWCSRCTSTGTESVNLKNKYGQIVSVKWKAK